MNAMIKSERKPNPILIIAEDLMRELPRLKRSELARYHQTPGHAACIKLLQKGFTNAYTELHTILTLNKEIYDEHCQYEMYGAYRGNFQYEVKINILENNPEKLEYLMNSLMNAEIEYRKGHWGTEFKIRTEVARHFHNMKDYWLSEFLFSVCLKIVDKLEYNSEPRKALILYEIGIHAEYKRDLDIALESLLYAHELASGRSWTLPLVEESLDKCISEALQRICIKCGMEQEKRNPEKAVKYYRKALDVATLARDKAGKALAHQKLGNALESMDKTDKCCQHFKILAKLSEESHDNKQLCTAYQSLARIYHGEGQWEVAMDFLYHCITVAEESHLEDTLISVRTTLALIYMSLGQFDNAFEQALAAFQLQVNNLNAPEDKQFKPSVSCDMSRVVYGVTKAHTLIPKFNVDVQIKDRYTLDSEFKKLYIEDKEEYMDHDREEPEDQTAMLEKTIREMRRRTVALTGLLLPMIESETDDVEEQFPFLRLEGHAVLFRKSTPSSSRSQVSK